MRDTPPYRGQDRIFPKENLRADETLPVELIPVGGKCRPTEGGGVRMESNRSKAISMNRVRELRENRLMTQAQLARKAKVALRTIHSVEKGMNCRMDTKRKILLALGLRFEDKDHVFPSSRMMASHLAGEPTPHMPSGF